MRRRTVLATIAAAMAAPGGLLAGAGEPKETPIEEDPAEVMDAICDLVKKTTGLPLRSISSPHYVCMGDAPASVRGRMAVHCESVLAETLRLFGRHGFAIHRPERKLNLVVLARRESYAEVAKHEGREPWSTGFFSLKYRAVFAHLFYQEEAAASIDWRSSIALIGHETMHQICFLCGLLSPRGDIAACVSEGLGILGEVAPGELPRLLHDQRPGRTDRLADSLSRHRIPLSEFFLKDDLIWHEKNEERVGDAYAQAWLLVNTLMTDPTLLPRFRAYVKAVNARTEKSHRLEDVETHLGKIDALEARLDARFRKLAERPASSYTSPRRRGGYP